MPSTKFAIAGMQINIPTLFAEGTSNLGYMEACLDDLMYVYPWVDMVVYSELCVLGPSAANAMPFPTFVLDAFCEMAKRYNIWLIPGTLYEAHEGKIYNTCPIIRPDGTIENTYRKMFPWYPYEAGIAPGNEIVTFDVPDVGRFGVMVCYDAWQPELWRTMAAMGVEVVLNPTMTDNVDIPIERSIIHSMAAINQMYIFHVNGFGGTGGACGWGNSTVAGPDGFIIHQGATHEEMFPIEIDLKKVRTSRKEGTRRLDQSLKSFRDRPIKDYDIYSGNYDAYLDSLGPLALPERSRFELMYQKKY